MKVRIQKNSIRFRLKQQEVTQFGQAGKVSEVLEFGADAENKLTFTLESFDEPELAVQFKANTTTIFVPLTLAEQWTTTELVGFDERIDTGKGRTISILVEKDFVCMDGREEDNVGSYPNPLMK
jgi:hypothetical protein